MHTFSAKHRRSTRRTSAVAVLAAAFLGAAALAVVPSTSADASDEVFLGPLMTGRAYSVGISDTKVLGSVVPNGASPDTGYVASYGSELFTKPCTRIPAGVVQATATCVAVVTDADRSKSTATTSVATAKIGVPGLPIVNAVAINATSATNCLGSGGATTIAYLKVGTKVLISAPTPIAPNTKLTVGVVSLTLNEQILTENGLLVNALHVKANVPGVARTNVVISSAQSGVSNCSWDYPTD